ncbi:hypothetical protein FACS1894123_07860 [Bacteroidia bacterium]|nr:hypothetical protein FACS1894123_07860 [Bacteroidia bacterium]
MRVGEIISRMYILIYFITNKLNKKRERKLMEEDNVELESQLVESLNSVKTIKQFGIEDFANIKTENRFIRLLDSVYKSSINSFFLLIHRNLSVVFSR